jgi:hypothetical protein
LYNPVSQVLWYVDRVSIHTIFPASNRGSFQNAIWDMYLGRAPKP